jgi:hypothetical protein
MSEVRLVIRDSQRDIYANWHGSFAERVVAALSAEPETIEELDAALERFVAPGERSHFAGFYRGVDDEPYDAGLVIVDLAARLVVCESTYFSPSSEGSVQFHDGNCATDVWVRYHLSEDWRLAYDANCWQPLAEARRRERAASPPLDVRNVLYGDPLLEFMARECLRSLASDAGSEAGAPPLCAKEAAIGAPLSMDNAEYALVREIHARWLTVPRGSLRGQSPRDVLLARKEHIDRDLQDRAEQWSRLERCPRGLERDSAAFRFAGFGTHEIVMYYELVRHLLWSCRDAARDFTRNARGAPAVGDFLTGEVPRLARLRDEWLDAPDPEFHGRTPREIIDHERARLPEAVSGHEAIVDHDCPLCAMQAELPGPMFWHLDGCNMDDDFAFSFHRTLEEWEDEQREYEEFSRRFDAEQAERKRLGVEYPGSGYADPDMVWQSSFSAPESAGKSLFMRLFSIGSHLSELIVDLKQPTEDRPSIDRLSRDFGNLREVVQSRDPAAAEALLEPVLDRFCESLETVAAARIELAPKCTSLQERLRRFLEPPEEGSTEAFDDDDLPF